MNGNRQREIERQTEIKGGSELYNQRRITNRKALPTAEALLPIAQLKLTQCEMQNRAADTVVHRVVNNNQVRGRSYIKAQYARFHLGLCHLRYVFLFFSSPKLFFSTPSVCER